MKDKINKWGLVMCMAFSILSMTKVQAQIPTAPIYTEAFNISEFLKAGSEDASTLMGQYLKPVFVGFGYGANGGWYNTAAAHKPLGFDLTVSVMAAKAPEDQYFFDFVGTGNPGSPYLNTYLDSSSPTDQGSTVFGSPDPNQQLILRSGVEDPNGLLPPITTTFRAPSGIDYSGLNIPSSAKGYVPFVMIQGGIGLFKNTDLKIRWVPTTKYDGGGAPFEIGMLGFGLMHDIKQWIPGIKHIPIDISAFIGYNRIHSTIGIDDSAPGAIQASGDAKAEFYTNTLTYQLIVSKKISVLTFYGGGGLNTADTRLKVLGTYDIPDDIDPLNIIQLTDPVNEKFKSNGWKGTVGARLQLAVITFHVDYTFQEYNMLTAGLGVSVR